MASTIIKVEFYFNLGPEAKFNEVTSFYDKCIFASPYRGNRGEFIIKHKRTTETLKWYKESNFSNPKILNLIF